MTNSKEVIVIGASANSIAQAVANDLFKDIDFSGVSSAIEAIGNAKGTLSPEEKEMANGIVDQWQKDVIQRLKDRGTEMSSFINLFETGMDGYVKGEDLLDEIGEDLAVKTKTEAEFKALIKEIEELDELKQTRPTKPIEHLDRTQKEKLEEDNKYRLETAKYELAVNKKIRDVFLAEKAWKKLLKENSEVKELIKKAKKFNKEMGKFTALCHDKAQIAKLNITVSDTDIRGALKDLLNFSTEV